MIFEAIRRPLALLTAAVLILGSVVPARAQEDFQIIRDTEIEEILRTLVMPVWRVANVVPENIDVVVIQDPSINAFVAGGQNIFLHSGLLLETDNAGQLIGVVAHETGHIAGGHLLRADEGIANASYEAILAMLLGGAAAAVGHGNVGAGILGGQEIGMRSLMAFSRGQESAADQAGLGFLEKAHLSARGLLDFFKKLQAQEVLPTSRQVEYVRTHPLTGDRIDAVQHAVDTSRWSDVPDTPEATALHARLKAKLLGYLQPVMALRRYPRGDTTIDGRYARAIAAFRLRQLDAALQGMDQLIAIEPNNPYFYEMKGQMLFENARVPEAVAMYRKAVSLKPEAPLLHLSLGHALIEENDPGVLTEAIKNLNKAEEREQKTPLVHHLLATAYGRQGMEMTAQLELSEEMILEGKTKDGRALAERVLKHTPAGSREWLKAQDLLSTSKPVKGEVRDADDRRSLDPTDPVGHVPGPAWDQNPYGRSAYDRSLDRGLFGRPPQLQPGRIYPN